jgi:hypothetical protein
MGRKDLLIHKLETACYAAGFQNAQEIVAMQLRVWEDHFGKTVEEIDAMCFPDGRPDKPQTSFAVRVRKASAQRNK